MLMTWVLHGQAGAPLCMDQHYLFLRFSARWFAMPFRDTLHHPYICPCFWRNHFYTPLLLDFIMGCKLHMEMADLLQRLPNNSGNKGMCPEELHGRVCSTLWNVAGWAT